MKHEREPVTSEVWRPSFENNCNTPLCRSHSLEGRMFFVKFYIWLFATLGQIASKYYWFLKSLLDVTLVKYSSAMRANMGRNIISVRVNGCKAPPSKSRECKNWNSWIICLQIFFLKENKQGQKVISLLELTPSKSGKCKKAAAMWEQIDQA